MLSGVHALEKLVNVDLSCRPIGLPQTKRTRNNGERRETRMDQNAKRAQVDRICMESDT